MGVRTKNLFQVFFLIAILSMFSTKSFSISSELGTETISVYSPDSQLFWELEVKKCQMASSTKTLGDCRTNFAELWKEQDKKCNEYAKEEKEKCNDELRKTVDKAVDECLLKNATKSDNQCEKELDSEKGAAVLQANPLFQCKQQATRESTLIKVNRNGEPTITYFCEGSEDTYTTRSGIPNRNRNSLGLLYDTMVALGMKLEVITPLREESHFETSRVTSPDGTIVCINAESYTPSGSISTMTTSEYRCEVTATLRKNIYDGSPFILDLPSVCSLPKDFKAVSPANLYSYSNVCEIGEEFYRTLYKTDTTGPTKQKTSFLSTLKRAFQ